MCRISIKKSAFKELQALAQPAIVQIETAIEELATNPRPHGCKKLKGGEALWRIRVGDYRVVYEK